MCFMTLVFHIPSKIIANFLVDIRVELSFIKLAFVIKAIECSFKSLKGTLKAVNERGISCFETS